MTMLIHFARPGRLWWLIVPVLLFLAWLVLDIRRRSVRSPDDRLRRVLPHQNGWKRWLAVMSSVASTACLVLAFAQPQSYRSVPRDRATIAVAIDVSRSMEANDVEPNRLTAAQDAAKEFVGSLPPRFNVALVRFAGTAQVVVPPTTDRGTVDRAIDNLKVLPSTAIGEGIYTSLDAIKLAPPDPRHPKEVAPAAIVLLSDGATNMGRPSLQAGRDSGGKGVPVYTIAYGTARGYLVEDGVRQRVPVNRSELAAVAKASGGEKFSAQSLGELKKVYREISHSVGSDKVYAEITDVYVGISVILALVAAGGAVMLAARWP